MHVSFEAVGRLPHPHDNVAIATCRLAPGTTIQMRGTSFTITDTILEGHRYAVQPIAAGDNLTSWGQPFGTAIAPIQAGDYVRNEAVIRELNHRLIDFTPPQRPNFTDQIAPFVFDEASFRPSPPLARYADAKTFMGYRRAGSRGVGTRNTIVLLGTSALTGGFVTALEQHLAHRAGAYPNIDGIVALAHTEGSHDNPNNRDLLLRTLAGFMVNPNVGAVIAVDRGTEPINNRTLKDYLTRHHYPIADMPHHFMSLTQAFQADMTAATAIVESWFATVNSTPRTPEPLSELKIALQCGGSDAFSGISGNPLAGWVTREVLRYGGSANLAETDELIGAELYTLDKVKDLETARKFLAVQDRFKQWAAWHGHTADGNPSGGNLFRGIYNIYLKSLGASTKRDPEVRLDYVIDYGELMRESGFYFMDSPGNDLESIAGQVASGCNLLYFVTGNGSITNFPFVPTIKIITTTERYNLLSNEMDVNAGAYLDDTPMDELGAATFQLTIDVASGQRSVGEQAGHSQVQIWRDWRLTHPVNLLDFVKPHFSGQPININTDILVPNLRYPAYRTPRGYTADQVGLILPTSLCSGQIAKLCTQQLNANHIGSTKGLSRFVTLVHTEGCGAVNGSELTDTLMGYLRHPLVRYGLLLEHGCEKTHNGYYRELMQEQSIDTSSYGWASVQLDGGIHKVTQKMARWFSDQLTQHDGLETVEVGLEAVRLGLISQGTLTNDAAQQFANLSRIIVAAGGTVVIPSGDPLLQHPVFVAQVLERPATNPTIDYAKMPEHAGFHIMFAPSRQWNELLTGLGATGVEVILAHVDDHPMSAHPLVPVLQVTANQTTNAAYAADLDAILTDSASVWADHLLTLMVETLARRYTPHFNTSGDTQFQITRGLLGISM